MSLCLYVHHNMLTYVFNGHNDSHACQPSLVNHADVVINSLDGVCLADGNVNSFLEFVSSTNVLNKFKFRAPGLSIDLHVPSLTFQTLLACGYYHWLLVKILLQIRQW